MRTLIVIALAALAFPAAAAAGGWATAGLAPPPDGIQAGDTWKAVVTIRAHGVTPMDGLEPTITIRGPDTKTFTTRPAGRPGTYVADIVFSKPGTYRYEVMDGYVGATHTFAPFEVGPVAAPTGGDFPGWAIAPIVIGGAALAALFALLLRRRAPQPAAAPH